MILHQIEENPSPPGAEIRAATAADGVRLRLARWPAAEAAPRGTVAVFQGRAEFIEKYLETIGELLARGFYVATLDWRGQGASDRLLPDPRKGHVRRFSDYGLDLDAFFAELAAWECPRPWYGLAHSMGGAILIEAVHSGRAPLDRLVCSAPMIGIYDVRSPFGVRVLATALSVTGLSSRFMPGGGATSIMTKPFAGNVLTGDKDRYERNAGLVAKHPALAIGDPTLGWIRAAFGQMARFAAPRYPLEIATPLLILAAGEDQVVSTPAIEAFAARSKTGPAILLPGARHEILQETDTTRAAFWAAFDAFAPGAVSPRHGREFGPMTLPARQ